MPFCHILLPSVLFWQLSALQSMLFVALWEGYQARSLRHAGLQVRRHLARFGQWVRAGMPDTTDY